MAAKKHTPGESVHVEEGVVVVRPDGAAVTVVGGVYVLDVPGTHLVGDKAFEVG